jgi:hypothetical protein
MEVQVFVAEAGEHDRLAPGGPEAIPYPRFAVAIAQDRSFWLGGALRIQHRLQRLADNRILSLNQRVHGSSPCALTIEIKADLPQNRFSGFPQNRAR